MIEFFKATTLVALVLCAWQIVLFLRFRQGPVSTAFAVFLGALMVPLTYNYFRLTVDSSPKLLEALSHSMLLFYGPYLFILLHLAIKRPLAFKALHLVPFFVITLFKTANHGEGLSQFLLATFVGHTLCYGVLNIRLVLKHRRHFMVVFQQFTHSSSYWLSLLAVGIVLICLADISILSLYVRGLPISTLAWQSVLFGLSAYVLAITFLTLKSLPKLVHNKAAVVNKAHAVQATDTPPERAHELSDNAATQLANELHQLMHDAELFRQNTLSLDDLASALGINKHKVSELLNVHIQISFYEYLNQLRIDYACKRLRDPTYQDSIIELAYEAGFNNKNSFYRSFKEKTKLTPSAFRQAERKRSTTDSMSHSCSKGTPQAL